METGQVMEVGVHIKTGPPGNERYSNGHSIQDLLWLHDVSATFDLESTWEFAIFKRFGRAIDPNRYYVRRVRTDHGQPPHSLKEKVKVLISEFLQVRKLQSVQIMEFDEQVPLSSVSNVDMTGRKASTSQNGQEAGQVNRGGVKRPLNISPTRESTPISTPRPNHHQDKRDKSMPVLVRNDGDPDRDHRAENFYGREVKRVKVQQHQSHGQSQVASSSTSAKVQLRRAPPSAAASGSSGKINRVLVETSERQKSSSQPEAFKAQFYDRAKKTVTNSQLLQARHALQELKATSVLEGKDNLWTKWVLESPFAASVLRTLFDV